MQFHALSWPAISPHDAHHQIGLSFTYVSVGFVCSWWRKIHHAGRHFGDSMKELGFVGLKMVTRWYGISESSTSDARIISLAWDKAMIIAIYLQIHVCPAYGQLTDWIPGWKEIAGKTILAPRSRGHVRRLVTLRLHNFQVFR